VPNAIFKSERKMKVSMFNCDAELKRTFDNILSDPEPWEGWSCINIKDPSLKIYSIAKELLYEAEASLYVFLKGMEGYFYMQGFEDIYVFQKSNDKNHLEKVASLVCEILNIEQEQREKTKIYDLGKQIKAFESDVIMMSDLYSPLSSTIYFYDKFNTSEQSLEDKLRSTTKDAKKVLVVEDDATTRWQYRKALKKHCVLYTAGNVKEAFSHYLRDVPDLVFLDLNLPDGSGYIILDWVLRQNPEAVIVVCSGLDDSANKEKAMDYGAKGYITKPFSRKDLVGYVENTDVPNLIHVPLE
jgi:PleD family two-component response regulator